MKPPILPMTAAAVSPINRTAMNKKNTITR
jgi:hypothetical protein